jgi:serine/threonine protein kinase/tetratricopeptide (TPR) repeat protein
MQQDWEVLERLFSEALDLPPEQRMQFVRDQSGNNLWLLNELETLLSVPESRVDAALDSTAGLVRDFLAAFDSEFAIGREVGGYRIQSQISAGGMGVVYRAEEIATGAPAALKLLPPEASQDPKRIRGMAREARALQLLSHPGIVRIKEYRAQPGCHFLAMELVEGETLRTVLSRGPIPLGQALDWSAQIAAAADAAHAKGVVHRDLKPSNIMIERATGQVKLLDFGLARLSDATPAQETLTTVDGTVAGTFSYFSPEQANGSRGDERSDIFSFGAILYEMIGGRRPFDRPGAVATAAAVLTEPPDALPAGVPLPLKALIERCLQKDPARRFAGMRHVAEGIENLRSLARRGKLKPAMPANRRIALAAVCILAAVSLAWYIGVRTSTPEHSIAVLPFATSNADPASRYLSSGLTTELTEALGRIKTLKVIAQPSAAQFSGKKIDLREAGRLLHVAAVLEGSVERQGDRFKLAARLERVADGATLWSNTYDRQESDLVAVQSEVTDAVAKNLNAGAATRPAKHIPRPEAHEYLIKARYETEQLTMSAIKQAEADLNHAIELDPEYAAAYYMLGTAKYDEYVAAGSISQTDAEQQESKRLLHKALEMDPDLRNAYGLLAMLAMQRDWDWDGAERQLKLALAGPPNSNAEIGYAFLLLFRGRFAEADEHIRRVQDLDPYSTETMSNVALIRNLEGRFGEASENYHKLAVLSPNSVNPKIGMSLVDVERGRTDQAIQDVAQWKPHPAAQMIEAMAQARTGHREEALRLIRPFEEKYPNPGAAMQWFALVYAFMGDEPNTVKWLERSADRHEWQALNLAVHPVYAPMRNSPRFQALERRMGLLK